MPRSLQRMLELKVRRTAAFLELLSNLSKAFDLELWLLTSRPHGLLQALAQGPKHKRKGPHNVERRLPAGGKTQTANGIGQKAAAPQDCAVGSSPAEFPRPADQTPSTAGNGQLFSAPLHQPQAPALESKQEDGKAHPSQDPADTLREQRRSSQQRASQQQQQQPILAAASSPGTKGLKARKKDFLKRRKLKKKGLLHLLEQEPEEDLEAELMQDRHKPKFGEQAKAPLKASIRPPGIPEPSLCLFHSVACCVPAPAGPTPTCASDIAWAALAFCI